MAPPIANAKGSALLEALPVALTLVLFVGGILAIFYFSFARVWLQYQGEQALLCLAQDQPACQSRLQRRIQDVLPFGDVERLELKKGERSWNLLIDWAWNRHHLLIKKDLRLRDLTRNKVSPYLRL
jgi:hypothetical protein